MQKQVPETLREDFDTIQTLLKQLRRGYTLVSVPNPAYVPPAEGQTTNVPLRVNQQKPLSEEETEIKAFKLSKLCKDLAKQLARYVK